MTGTRAAHLIVLLALAALAAAILVGGGAEPLPLDSAPDAAPRERAGEAPARERRVRTESLARTAERGLEPAAPLEDASSAPQEHDGRVEVVVVVRDHVGRPASGVDVVAEPANPTESRVLRRRDRKGETDRHGRCRLRLFDGPFWIGANRRATDPELTAESARVTIGRDLTEVVLELRRRTASLHVVCIDDRDAAVEGVEVQLMPDDLSAATGTDGRAGFEALPVGRHRVRFRPSTAEVTRPADEWRHVDLLAGARELLTVRLPRRGRLEVRVVPPPQPAEVVSARAEAHEVRHVVRTPRPGEPRGTTVTLGESSPDVTRLDLTATPAVRDG